MALSEAEVQRSGLWTFPEPALHLEGIQDSCLEVMDLLSGDEDRPRVISLTGPPGIGACPKPRQSLSPSPFALRNGGQRRAFGPTASLKTFSWVLSE